MGCRGSHEVIELVLADNYKVVAVIDGCEYYAYTVYSCVAPAPSATPTQSASPTFMVQDGEAVPEDNNGKCLSGTRSCDYCGHPWIVPNGERCTEDNDCQSRHCSGRIFDITAFCTGYCTEAGTVADGKLAPDGIEGNCLSGRKSCDYCGHPHVVPSGKSCTDDSDCQSRDCTCDGPLCVFCTGYCAEAGTVADGELAPDGIEGNCLSKRKSCDYCGHPHVVPSGKSCTDDSDCQSRDCTCDGPLCVKLGCR